MLALFPFLVTDWNTWALATYSLGVAADLCFFTKVCPAVSESVSSASAARRGAAVRRVWLQAGGHGLGHLGPGRSVELGLARILGAGGGPEQGGQRSHRPPRHLGSAVGGQQRLLVDAGHAGDW